MAYKNKEDQAASARRHYLANKEVMKARAVAKRRANKALSKPYVDNLKATTPCRDCKRFFHPESMDFDHLKDKGREVSILVNSGFSLDKVKAEIAKCVLVCASCHRVRTFLRRQGFILI